MSLIYLNTDALAKLTVRVASRREGIAPLPNPKNGAMRYGNISKCFTHTLKSIAAIYLVPYASHKVLRSSITP